MRALWDQQEPPSKLPAAARATAAFVAFALGEALALSLWREGVGVPSGAWFGAASLVLAIAGAMRRPPRAPVLALATLLLAGGWFTARIPEGPRGSLRESIPDGPGAGAIVTVEGVVLKRPEAVIASGALAEFVPGSASAWFPLALDGVVTDGGPVASRGRVRVTVRGGDPAVAAGDRVRITGVAEAIRPPMNPGESDARLWAAQDRVVADLLAASPALIEPLPPSRSLAGRLGRAWLVSRAWLRARAEAMLGRDGEGSPAGATLAALLLGASERDTAEVRAVFARQGLAHVLAISGFHLAVMAGAALFAVRLTGDRGRLEPVIVGVLVLAYMVILPAQAPILRSGAIVLVWMVSEALGRRYDRRALLAWVAIGVLVVRPMDLFSLGYQLTFGVTGALVWLGAPVHARMFPTPLEFRREPPDLFTRRWWIDRTARLVSASVLCWLVATPLVAWSVGVVSPTAVLSTLIVVPAVTVLLWAGFAAMLVGVAVPAAGEAATSVLEHIAGAVVFIVELFDRAPGTTLYVPGFSLALCAAITGLACWWLLRGRLRSPGLWAATLLCLGWFAGEMFSAGRTAYGVALRIDTLSVGDGTCHLLRSGRGALLWDCGSLSPSIGVRTIPRAVRALGAAGVPDAVVTHADFDHYSGLPDALRQLGVRRLWVGRSFLERVERDPGGAAAACLEMVRGAGVEVRTLGAGDRLTIGAASIEFLSPPEALFATENDNSLVARIAVPTRAGERSALLCGDIQREAMATLMFPGAHLRADVLELPHHGSVHATALDFVAAVDPDVVLQSTGPSRASEIRWNALRAGRTWWMTAESGAAWVEIGADGEIASNGMGR